MWLREANMAKQVIILRASKGNKGDDDVEFLYWIPVVAARRVPIAGGTSRWAEASASENSAIATGAVIEIADRCQFASSLTTNQIKTALESRWAAKKTEIDELPNPNRFYGVNWDPTVGTNGGWSA